MNFEKNHTRREIRSIFIIWSPIPSASEAKIDAGILEESYGNMNMGLLYISQKSISYPIKYTLIIMLANKIKKMYFFCFISLFSMPLKPILDERFSPNMPKAPGIINFVKKFANPMLYLEGEEIMNDKLYILKECSKSAL
ncbi:MAG: hypothetical protein LBI28_02520 [Treponema sp.]|nr:hypothetical protein [Treponema sp.]